jgi:hypothetical protein
MEHDRTLDEEGVPDLEGPLPEKEATGDPQEGLPPPNDRPRASVDFGITAEEQAQGESLDRRIEREEPDLPIAADPAGVSLVEDDESSIDGLDVEPELLGDAVPAGDDLLSPEERALHIEGER